MTLIGCSDDPSTGGGGHQTSPGDAPLEGAVQVFHGSQANCAAVADDSLYCWGFNATGQSGRTCPEGCSSPARPLPGPLLAGPVDGLDEPIVELDGDLWTTCARAESGTVYCWGEDSAGSLGPGEPTVEQQCLLDRDCVASAFQTNIDDATALGTSSGYSCAARATGDVQCWGEAKFGAFLGGLGDAGSGQDSSFVPDGWTPTQLELIETAACALSEAGEVWCWGNGMYGALGRAYDDDTVEYQPCQPNGVVSPIDFCTTQPEKVPGLSEKAIALVGENRGFCALMESGSVECWGHNGSGRFNTGVDPAETGDYAPQTAQLPEGVTPVQIALGDEHLCLRTSDGEVFCAGSHEYAQIGQTQDADGFVAVALPDAATELSAGYLSSCAVLADSQVACWGANPAGQLGVEQVSDSDATVPFNDGAVIVQVGGPHGD